MIDRPDASVQPCNSQAKAFNADRFRLLAKENMRGGYSTTACGSGVGQSMQRVRDFDVKRKQSTPVRLFHIWLCTLPFVGVPRFQYDSFTPTMTLWRTTALFLVLLGRLSLGRAGDFEDQLVLSVVDAHSSDYSYFFSFPNSSVISSNTLELTSVSASHFTRLTHPVFPGRSVRIKKSGFCDGTVKLVLRA